MDMGGFHYVNVEYFVRCVYILTVGALQNCPDPLHLPQCPHSVRTVSGLWRESCAYIPEHPGVSDVAGAMSSTRLNFVHGDPPVGSLYNQTHLMLSNYHPQVVDESGHHSFLSPYCYQLNTLVMGASAKDDIAFQLVDVYRSHFLKAGFEYARSCVSERLTALSVRTDVVEIASLPEISSGSVYIHDCSLHVHICYVLGSTGYHLRRCSLKCGSIHLRVTDASWSLLSVWHTVESFILSIVEKLVREFLRVVGTILSEFVHVCVTLAVPVLEEVLPTILTHHLHVTVLYVTAFVYYGRDLSQAMCLSFSCWLMLQLVKVTLTVY